MHAADHGSGGVGGGNDWYCCAGDGRRRRDQREADYRKHHDIDDRELCP
ncbi:hypothetical protein [Evtepia gabavorous]